MIAAHPYPYPVMNKLFLTIKTEYQKGASWDKVRASFFVIAAPHAWIPPMPFSLRLLIAASDQLRLFHVSL